MSIRWLKAVRHIEDATVLYSDTDENIFLSCMLGTGGANISQASLAL